MRRSLLAVVLVALAVGAWAQAVLVQVGDRSLAVDLADDLWPTLSGTVRYQGPTLSPNDPNWKPAHSYRGIPLAPLVEALGGMQEGDLLHVIAVDGYTKALPRAVVTGQSPLGTPILAFERDGVRIPAWEEGPELVFLPADGAVSNEDMLAALGERAHFFQGLPSTTGLLVKAVQWLVVNWDASFAALPAVGAWPEEATVTVASTEERTYTMRELETHFAAVTGPGTFVNRVGREIGARYTGIPLADLLGPWPPDTEVEAVAADGYRMRYRYGDLVEQDWIWILAFKQDGVYLPFDPGYFRLVKVGPGNPRFESARSARMVIRVEVHGTYESYTLRLQGQVERTFTRAELEAGVGCPCHARTVTATRNGEAHAYSGLPLWRLLAYVDDDRFPPAELGIHYDDADFNDALAAGGYTVEIRAADGFSQRIPVRYLARDDRYILALQVDGRFLAAADGGPLLLVWDDAAPVPEGLRRVKWVAEIVIRPD
ncbi:MAG: molybdopterin-dependent oxidoreductase [Candidatus Acetothermia bacterium]|jgi:hypothetical protein|nr:molybdopterin-dependent oxidoreductase [Candidatus Acetothermia bacterium]